MIALWNWKEQVDFGWDMLIHLPHKRMWSKHYWLGFAWGDAYFGSADDDDFEGGPTIIVRNWLGVAV